MMALIKPKNIPLAFKLHLGDHLGVGKVFDTQQYRREMVTEDVGQPLDRGLSQRLDISKRRRGSLTDVHYRWIEQLKRNYEDRK